MYFWVLRYPTQVVKKEVNGELREVTVIGGEVPFRTRDDAERYACELGEFWPGFRYVVKPLLGDRPAVGMCRGG